MRFYFLEPEVAGGFGDNVEYDPATRQVSHLHYRFDGWLGDDILESFPCYIITQRLRNAISNVADTGFSFAEIEVSTSEQFRKLYPNRNLPPFWWLQISGQPGEDDFGISADNRLVVSERVLEAMQKHGQLKCCDITNVN